MPFDVVAVGDATLDVFLTLNEKEADLRCDLSRERCQICLDYSAKIPLEAVDFSLGGNAANVAVGLKRLGLKSALYTILGDDETGEMIAERLRNEGLAGPGVQRTGGRSSYSTAINFKGERTILEKKYPHRYVLSDGFPKEVSYLYVSSLGTDYESFFKSVTAWAERNEVRLGFNPAQVQLRSDFKTYAGLVRAARVLFLNREEAGQMLGRVVAASDVKTALKDLSRLGPKYVALTDGRKGAYVFDGEKSYFCDIFPAERVEATGAGDAFAAGFFGAIISKEETASALKWAMINSAAVVEKVGAVAGLLTRNQIEERIRKNPEFVPQEI